MSSTIKAAVLAKAVELWADPAKRLRRRWYDHKGARCAAGVISVAHGDVTGKVITPDEFRNYAMMLGYPYLASLIDDNDRGNQDYIYARMQDALAKELA